MLLAQRWGAGGLTAQKVSVCVQQGCVCSRGERERPEQWGVTPHFGEVACHPTHRRAAAISVRCVHAIAEFSIVYSVPVVSLLHIWRDSTHIRPERCACPSPVSPRTQGQCVFPAALTHLQASSRVCSSSSSKQWGVQPLRAASSSSQQDAAQVGDEQPRRVVVTGMGVVSPLGHELDEFYNNLLAGKSGISLIEGFDTADYSTRFAGEIKELDASPYIIKKLEKRVDGCIRYVMVAGKKALQDAGLDPERDAIKDLDKARCGILIGSAMGGMTSFANAVEALITAGHRKMNPFCIPFAINNMGGAMLAMDVGFMGPNYSISTACATGNYCIHAAAEHVRRGDADLMLAGAADAAVIPSGMAGFIACKALSKRNDDPAGASRPWDVERDGFVMGEGAGVLVLEDYEHAKARGAKIYAEWGGGAFSCDAHHMTEPHPDGRGVKQCINRALQTSGISAQEVDYVNAHATSTQAGDMAEYRALNEVFPQDSLRMNSTKSMIGHLLGGAGAVEAVATIKAIETGMLHPSINLINPESGIDLKRVCAGVKQQHKVDVALSNSFGFGGHNSCILFKRHQS